ncbi:hypothetical protein [Providencia alcalifaciens]|uniref:hypothetical protein n=1 Tax=Providencia alcalifaciens TaxID=126385 RepID=UPI0024ABD38E|nr:hypothetical protein [Providencia rettgeri]
MKNCKLHVNNYISDTRKIKMDARTFITYADKHSDIIESSKFVPAELGSNSFGYFIVEEKGSGLMSYIDNSNLEMTGTDK